MKGILLDYNWISLWDFGDVKTNLKRNVEIRSKIQSNIYLKEGVDDKFYLYK